MNGPNYNVDRLIAEQERDELDRKTFLHNKNIEWKEWFIRTKFGGDETRALRFYRRTTNDGVKSNIDDTKYLLNTW